MDFIQKIDASIVTFANSFAGKDVALDRIVLGLSELDLVKGAVVTALLGYVWFVADGRLAGPRMVFGRSAIGLVAAMLVSRGMQLLLPFRPRPRNNPLVDFTFLTGQSPDGYVGWSSFPSDHAALYFAAATAVFSVNRRAGVFAYLWAVFFICLPRLCTGTHYLSDLMVGAAIGIACMWAALRISIPAVIPSLLGRWEKRHALSLYSLAFLFAFQIATVFDDSRRVARYIFKAFTGIEL